MLLEALVQWRKCSVLVLVKLRQNFALVCFYNDDDSYLFVNGKEICKFKADNKNVNFPT